MHQAIELNPFTVLEDQEEEEKKKFSDEKNCDRRIPHACHSHIRMHPNRGASLGHEGLIATRPTADNSFFSSKYSSSKHKVAGLIDLRRRSNGRGTIIRQEKLWGYRARQTTTYGRKPKFVDPSTRASGKLWIQHHCYHIQRY